MLLYVLVRLGVLVEVGGVFGVLLVCRLPQLLVHVDLVVLLLHDQVNLLVLIFFKRFLLDSALLLLHHPWLCF